MTEQKSYRPLVYICSRFAGNREENLRRTEEFCRFAMDEGMIPLSGTLAFSPFMNDENIAERTEAISWDLILMGKCDECWALVTDTGISPGMAVEIERAKKRRQKVRYFNERFEEVQL